MVDGRPSFVPVEGTETELEVDLVLLAMGFTGPERNGLLEDLGVELDERGNVAARRALGDARFPVCSWPATPGAARASSCGRSPRAVPARPRSTVT